MTGTRRPHYRLEVDDTTDDTDITVVSRAELRAAMDQGDIHLLDVLPSASYATRHIPGATNMPVAVLHATAEATYPDHTAPLVVYCSGYS